MIKFLTKFSSKLIILALLGTMVWSAMPSQTAYAAQGTCPAGGWEQIPNSKSCTKTFVAGNAAGQAGEGNKNVKCPSKYEAVNINGLVADCRPTLEANLDGDTYKDLLAKVKVLNVVQKVLNHIIWPVLVMIGGLLDNSLLFGNGMEARLRDIWIPIRNLVNILFVIILVGIALYNVLGLGEDNSTYSIKETLPKIIVGIIAINFSFLGIKVFLDGINVLTTAVFSLPTQVGQGLDEIVKPDSAYAKQLCAQLEGMSAGQLEKISDTKLNANRKEDIYRSIMGSAGSKYAIEGFDPIKSSAGDIEAKIAAAGWPADKKKSFDAEVEKRKSGFICDATTKTLNEEGKKFLSSYSSRNAALALALNMGKIVFYQDINSIDIENIDKLLVNTIFSMVLYIVYAVSFVALFVVLLGRLVVMWLSIAISPILLLLLFAPDLKSKLGGFGEVADTFVKNAIAPLMISLSLTVGWIMLNALQNLNSFDTQSPLNLDPTQGFPVAGLNTIQDATVALATIAVVWMGVFSAAEGTVAKDITGWMGEKVKAAGSFLGRLPLQHTPFIPIKLPGSAPGEPAQPFTGAQIATALRTGLDNMTDDRALVKALGMDKHGDVPPATDLRAVKDNKELISYFGKRLQGGATLDKSDHAEIRRLMTTDRSKWNEIQTQLRNTGNSQDKEVADALQEIGGQANPDGAQLKTATERLKKHDKIRNPDIQKTPAEAATGPKPIDETTTIINNKFDTAGYLKTNPGQDAAAAKTQAIQDFNTKVQAIKPADMNTDQLKAALKNLRFAGYKADGTQVSIAPTPDEVKSYLSLSDQDELDRKMTPGDIDKALE